MSIAYPLPRQTRQATLAASAGQTVFGPFDFILFDADDVDISVKAAAAQSFTLLTPDQYSVTPAAPAAVFPALFIITLATARGAGDQVEVKGVRLGSRTTDVTRAGRILSQPLEAELDRQVATEQELRRDIDFLAAQTPVNAEGIYADMLAARDATAADRGQTSQDRVQTGLDRIAAAASAAEAADAVSEAGKPIFILTTGQSNYAAVRAFAWTPNVNAKIWNNTVDTAGAVGNAFVALSAATVGLPAKLASDIADAYPSRKVYLLNIAHSGQPISHWMTGTGSPDAYGDIEANITAALAAAEVSKIDLFCWWQGEADSVPTISPTYLANHATVMTRFWGNSWFPRETPVIINGMSSQADAGGLSPNADNMNAVLAAVANADPDKRRFVYTAALGGSTYWDVSNPGHMTGQGYFSAGSMTANAFIHGTGRNHVQGVTTKPSTGTVVVGTPGSSSTANFAINANTSQLIPEHSTLGPAVSQKYGKDATFSYELFDSFGHTCQYIGRRANGTAIAKTAIAAGDVITGFAAQGYNGSAYTDNRASIVVTASQNWTPGANGTYWSFFNTRDGTTAVSESLRVFPGGIKILATTGSDVDIDGLAWTPWVPSVTAFAGAFTALGTVVARYKKIGKTVFFYVVIPITTNGTAATAVVVTLPFTAADTGFQSTIGRESGVTGHALSGRIAQNTATLQLAKYDGSYPGQNGAIICASGQYETT